MSSLSSFILLVLDHNGFPITLYHKEIQIKFVWFINHLIYSLYVREKHCFTATRIQNLKFHKRILTFCQRLQLGSFMFQQTCNYNLQLCIIHLILLISITNLPPLFSANFVGHVVRCLSPILVLCILPQGKQLHLWPYNLHDSTKSENPNYVTDCNSKIITNHDTFEASRQ